MTTELAKHDLHIERDVAVLPTALKAFKGKAENPAIGLIAEPDALPELGHACGHNVIAADALGAATGLSELLNDVRGRVVVFETSNERG